MEIIVHTTTKPNVYEAYLGDTLLCTSRLPFFDGARVMLKLGYLSETMVNMCHKGKAYPSFVSISLAKAAKLTVRENDEDGLRVRLYEPFPLRERNQEVNALRCGSKPAGSVTHGNEAVLSAE